MADVEAFVEPICVVPDVGHDVKRKYFMLEPRRTWSEKFINWLESPHKYDDVEDIVGEIGDDDDNDEPDHEYLDETDEE